MSPLNKLGAVILAAGASSRMGRPKLLLPWRETTIIGHLLAQWRELGAAQIAVVLRPEDSALAAELDRLNFPKPERVANPQPERGMFSSIVCAANWTGWQTDLARWAIVLGDQPHLRPETLRQLLEFSAQNPDAICQPQFGRHARHPVILPRMAFEALKNPGADTLEDFLKLSSCRRRHVVINDDGLAIDLDTPQDYAHASAAQPDR